MSIPKVKDGALKGFAVLTVNMTKFYQYVQAAINDHVGYGLGAKDPHPGSGAVDYRRIDCSGFVRTVLRYATDGQANAMPDGSFLEADWFKAQGFKPTEYSNASLHDGYLRIGIHRPGGRGGDSVGHIWFILDGVTTESYGGHGPGHRSWQHQWFLDHVDETYVLAAPKPD